MTVRRTALLPLMLALAFVSPARANAVPGEHSHSFDGTCSVHGIVHFDPPATYVQQTLDVDYRASGACTGTVDGRNVIGAPITMHNHARSDGSCVHAQTIEPGKGAMTFGNRGPTVSYSLEFTYAGSDGVQTFHGQRSGSAVGRGSFLTQPDPGTDGAADCFGAGVSDISMDLTLVTQSPLVSSDKRQW